MYNINASILIIGETVCLGRGYMGTLCYMLKFSVNLKLF